MTTNEATAVREVPGLTVKEGPCGRSLCATKAFSKGDILLSETRSQIMIQEYDSMEDFESAMAEDGDGGRVNSRTSYLLQHSVPAVSGRVVCMAEASPFSYLNHAHEPNVSAPFHHSDIDRSSATDVFSIIALRDIDNGEYVCFDYNLCAGYDVRKDAPMLRFLELCAKFGEEKRPSKFKS